MLQEDRDRRAAELIRANEELAYQIEERDKRAAELVIANKELAYQNAEKDKRAAELVIANKELAFQNEEKDKRAAELVIANQELAYQNEERDKRAAELVIANKQLAIAENNHLQSETRLIEAQEIGHIGNFEMDMLDNAQVWSDEMFKIFGISKEQVTPSIELLYTFIHPHDIEFVKAKMFEAFKSFQPSATEFRFIRSDGVVRCGYVEAKFEFNNTKLARVYGIIQDISDRKLAEIERTRMVNDLMMRNKDLEQFAYIISHNLRAPVANIVGALSVLKHSGLSAEDIETLNSGINASVLKLDTVVKDLNQILQVKGGINENKETVVFSNLVDDVKSSIRDLIDKYSIEISYDFSELDTFLTLKPYLYSIFYNLISNSVKYRKQDIQCSINIKSRLEKSKFELIFTDNGTGIDLKKSGEHVFGLYKRFHEDIEGKGMGLYMVKTQVEALSGRITIKSSKNEGTEFTIEFETGGNKSHL